MQQSTKDRQPLDYYAKLGRKIREQCNDLGDAERARLVKKGFALIYGESHAAAAHLRRS